MNTLLIVFIIIINTFASSQTASEKCKKYRPYLLTDPAECCQGVNYLNHFSLVECGFLGTMYEERHRYKRGTEENIRYIAPRTETDIIHGKQDECRKWICLYKNMNFLDGSYNIDKKSIQSYLDTFFSEQYWFLAKDRAFSYCLWNTRRITKKYEPCKPKALNTCLQGMMFKSCPIEAWKNTPKCNMLQQFIDECIFIEKQFRSIKYSIWFEYVK